MKFLSALPNRITTILVCSCLLVVASCQRENVNVPFDQKLDASDPTIKYILSLGFNKDKIVDYGNFYAVEDIAFEKGQVSNPNARPSQLANYTHPLIDYNVSDAITVRVGDIPDDTWRNEIITATQAAIVNWNNVSNKKYHFTYTGGPSANVTVQYANVSPLYAVSSFPNCNAGPLIRVNSSTNGLTASQQTFIMTHELGHILGLRHTDETPNAATNYLIQGTPTTDAQSLMNTNGPASATTYPPSVTSFTSNDLLAVRTLYPVTAAANATYNGTTDRIETTWTPSYFCDSLVTVQVKKPDGFYTSAISVANKGIYKYEPINSGTYTIFISNSSRALQASAVF